MKNYDAVLAGKRIQKARNAKGYTQEALAEMIDMNTKNVSRLENGTMGLSVFTLISLCNSLDVSADYILFGITEGNEKNTAMLLLSKLPEDKQVQAEKVLEAFVKAFES